MNDIFGSIIVAICAMVGTIVGSSINSNKNLEVQKTQFEAFKEKIEEQLGELITEIKGYRISISNIIERLTKLEGRVTELEHDIRDIKEVK